VLSRPPPRHSALSDGLLSAVQEFKPLVCGRWGRHGAALRRLLHETLWRANLPWAHACLAHPFVQALGEGTLKPDLFRAFIAQDAFFLGAFRNASNCIAPTE
jgi:hypothetical protein